MMFNLFIFVGAKVTMIDGLCPHKNFVGKGKVHLLVS